MKTMHEVAEVEGKLAEILEQMVPGEELQLTRDGRVVARLYKEVPRPTGPREPGRGKEGILYMAEDFDAPLEEFKEYME